MNANKEFFMRYASIVALTIIFVLSSCGASKKKKREELGVTGELFENTTAKFNGYFNARELWNEKVAELGGSLQYNYNQVIPIFPYVASDQHASYNSDMDKCIEKLATVITKHPASDWVDDSYLLMAKSFFVKKSYEEAIGTLEFLMNKYSPGYLEKIEGKKVKADKKKKKGKKKKKKKKAPAKRYESINQYAVYDGGIVDKLPAFYESLIWLAHAYTIEGQYIYAELALDRFEKYEKLPKRIKRIQHPVRAEWHLQQGDLAEAVTSLKKAIESSHDNYTQARYSFIIGQLETKLKNYTSAAVAYEECIKFKPVYELVFSAELKKLQLDAMQEGSQDKIQKGLERMINDGKNKEYLDQIYFTMARLAVEKGDLVAAEDYYKKSVRANVGDQPQLAESYYYLAEMNYGRQNYLDAKYYFDSTLMFMNKVDVRYFDVEAYSNNLSGIALHLETIKLNDSTLVLVKMNDKERRDFAYLLEQDKKANRENRASAKSGIERSRLSNASASRGVGTKSKRSSGFYAYDEKKKKKSAKQFEKVWGEIKLDDFWRVSSYGNQDLFDSEETESFESLVLSDQDVDRILAFIPSTPEDQAKLKEEIIEAMYQLGILYRDRLGELNKSVEVHEQLLSDYPNNVRELETLFYLYLTYTDLGNDKKVSEYKNKVIGKYPESSYAKALTDPEFLKLTLDKEQRIKSYYDDVYLAFNNSQYKEALAKINTRQEKFEMSSTYASKFELLAAMCVGNIEGRQEYVRALREVIGKYKGSAESKRAKEILDILGLYGSVAAKKIASDTIALDSTNMIEHNFKYKPDALHYAIISYDNTNLKTNDAKVNISNFNNKYFRLSKLKVSNHFLDTSGKNPMLIIRKFKNGVKAEEFTQVLIEKQDEVLAGKAFVAYPISQYNYRELIRIKSVDTYVQFYQENYIK